MRLFRACDCYSVFCIHYPDPRSPFGADYRVYCGPYNAKGLFIGRSGKYPSKGDVFIGRADGSGGYIIMWPKRLKDYQMRLKND